MEKKLEILSGKINIISQNVANNLSESNRKVWLSSEKQIRRAIKLFDGEKHFIIVTGMLKAGKSTLIDLLARTSKASLVGFGVDTTLRPAVIKMSDTEVGHIKIYYKPDGLDWASAMQEVTDNLRGIKDYNKKTVDFELTEDNLRKTLCRIPSESENCLTSEPLLVIVEVPKNQDSKFFNNDCVLLDMPGLDSGYSEQSSDPEKYKAFFDECDLLLFVQSSVSPINDKAGQYLKYIGLTRDESTYRLVQNVMNAKYWLKSDVTNKEQRRQAKNGKEVFRDKLGKGDVEVTPVYVNLGMAYDALLGNENDISINEAENVETKKHNLLAESHFLEMEDGFITDIQNNGQYRHIAHCEDMLRLEIKKTITKIEQQISDISNNIKELETERTENEKIISIIKKSYEGYKFRPMQFALSSEFVSSLKKNLNSEFESLRKSTKYGNKLSQNTEDENTDKLITCKPKIVNEFLDDCVSLAKSYAEKFFKDTYLDDLVYKENGKEKNAIEYAQDDLRAIADNLKDHGIKLNDEKISAKVNKIGDLDSSFCFSTYDLGKYPVKYNWFGFQKKIDFRKVSKYDEIINHYKSELEKIISSDNNVARRLTSLVQSVVKDDLEPQMLEYEKKLTALNSKIATLSSDKVVVVDILQQLNELQVQI
jgi:hypothetical protein